MIIISEFGIKIKNIEAATLYEYNLGLRDHYDYKDAMLTNSLFKDFLVENGLDIYKEESTRDIICIEFNFGTRDFETEIKHLDKLLKKYSEELEQENLEKKTIEKINNKIEKIKQLKETAINNKNIYKKISKEEIRDYYYINGVDVPYIFRKKDGTIKKIETLHYKRLFRSTGKAKKGTCMFIREELFNIADDYLRIGITLPETNAPIVEIEAYKPLIASGIVGYVKINPKNILILKDIDKFMTRDVISIETDENKQCHGIKRENYTLKNTLFDGQALIDSSIFPEWGDGYILLRQHFCKMAAFCTHIQKFFKNYFGDEYETATVTDMFGNIHHVKDIELITTDNAVKWLKFDGITYEYWCDKVSQNGNLFGVVKTAHESKFKDIGGLGNVQKMSYQMINSLDEEVMDNVLNKSKTYIESLKSDTNTFLEYLKKRSNFSNDYEVLIALVEQNPEFVRSDYFRQRRKRIIDAYVLSLKNGEVLNTADNLVIVGSPYAMLLYGATGNPDIVDQDDTFTIEENVIQCYTGDFKDNEYLAFFRSPFNSKNNLTYLHNVYDDRLLKYFELGKLCIAVNMIGTDFQDKNNG